jgi:CheY-like chemotaxis protein
MISRILVVDDNDVFRCATTKFLLDAAFEVGEAYDYRRALDVIEDGQPLALLLTDISLPTVNGFALARMGRTHHLGLPVIYMTAFDIPTDEARGPVLRKPLDLDVLLAEIRKLLSKPAA